MYLKKKNIQRKVFKKIRNRKTNLNSFRPSLSTTKFINNWEKVNTQVDSPSCPLFQAFEKKVSLLLVVKSELSLNHHSLYRTKENRTHFPHRTISHKSHKPILVGKYPWVHTCQSGFLCSGKSWKYLCASCRGGRVCSFRFVHERRKEARWTNV